MTEKQKNQMLKATQNDRNTDKQKEQIDTEIKTNRKTGTVKNKSKQKD